MKRIDEIRNLSVEELAEIIIEANVTDEYCDSSCEDEECNHEKECCIRWLNEEVKT